MTVTAAGHDCASSYRDQIILRSPYRAL